MKHLLILAALAISGAAGALLVQYPEFLKHPLCLALVCAVGYLASGFVTAILAGLVFRPSQRPECDIDPDAAGAFEILLWPLMLIAYAFILFGRALVLMSRTARRITGHL